MDFTPTGCRLISGPLVFFPNNDASPFRRIRIQRAQEYGARWVQTWGEEENITHVIVDKGLTFQDVLKHLKLETFPVSLELSLVPVPSADLAKSTIALVDEGYPAECIGFREVLSTKQTRFRVKGVPVPPVVKEPVPAEEASSIGSLQLKPAGKQQQAPTPSQSPTTSNNEAGVQVAEPPEVGRDETVLEARPLRERDALDEMIDEAKAVKDLVGEMIIEKLSRFLSSVN